MSGPITSASRTRAARRCSCAGATGASPTALAESRRCAGRAWSASNPCWRPARVTNTPAARRSTRPPASWSAATRWKPPTARTSPSRSPPSRSTARTSRSASTDRIRPPVRSRRAAQEHQMAPKSPAENHKSAPPRRPTREEAERAVRTLLEWAGDDPEREGLKGTPSRVVRAFEEYFAGYAIDPVELLHRTFEETDGYDEMVVLKDIRFESHCEHHLAPIIGKAHVAYLPQQRVVGISKLARLVEVYAKRLQIQEKMTAQIANTLDEVLQPKGVAVVIEAAHQCMTTRGVHKPGVSMVTSRMLGAFRTDPSTRREFLAIIGQPATSLGGP